MLEVVKTISIKTVCLHKAISPLSGQEERTVLIYMNSIYMKALKLIFICLFATVAFAEKRSTEQAQQGVLWSIKKEGIRDSYLLGTIHLGDPRVTRLSPALTKIVDQTSSIIGELSMVKPEPVNVAKMMTLQEGGSLQMLLTPQEYEALETAFIDKPSYRMILPSLKPWAASVLLLQVKLAMGESFDLQLQKRYQSAGKAVYGLETMQEQTRVFDSLKLYQQLGMLRDTLAYQDEIPRLIEEMIEAYLAGDLTALMVMSNAYIYGSNVDLKTFMDELITQRNIRMAERSAYYLLKGNVLIAVGALHLPGEMGLINLFKQVGFQLDPVPFE